MQKTTKYQAYKMKFKIKLMMLILILLMSLKSFSQIDTDTTSIQLKKPIVRLVIKDLILGDGAQQELILTLQKIQLLEKKIALKDSIIFNKDKKLENFQNLLDTREEQLILSTNLSKELEHDLKTQKLKNKLTIGGGVIVIIGTLLLLN